MFRETDVLETSQGGTELGWAEYIDVFRECPCPGAVASSQGLE